jgi:7,8-dihydropterin-6-yl-methyl-4-(beta-D-ribofuranosyl)aminobenzene 5'-phosphate synthase
MAALGPRPNLFAMNKAMKTDTIKITILIDNQAGAGLAAEHGFSLWIETAERHILFDTGQSSAFEKNARALGIDLAATDILVLSHGHYDHTGGVSLGLRRAGKASLYCHPGAVHPRYGVRNGMSKSLQMPLNAMRAIDKLSWEQVHWVQQPLFLTDTIGLTGPIPRESDFEDTGGPFFLDAKGLRPDPVDDDMALWIRTDKGLIVCVGCAHAGLVNTLNHVQRLNQGMRIRTVIGGFHLLNADGQRIAQTIAALRVLAPDQILPCHCTGEDAVAELSKVFAETCCPGKAGMVFVF